MTQRIQWARPNDVERDESDGATPVGPPPTDDRADSRSERLAADARYQEFVARQPPERGPCDPQSPGHVFDRCVTDRIPNPVLFRRQKDDVDALDPKDIQQGWLGDCAFLAPVAALASTPAGRSLLRNAIVENKNDKGDVVSWTVTFHRPESHWYGETTYKDVRITVAGDYVVGHARPRGENGQFEIWPAVLEKAYAQYQGGYDNVDRGAVPRDAMTLLTGREATLLRFSWPARLAHNYDGKALRADLAAGKIVVFSTRPIGAEGVKDGNTPEADSHKLHGQHAYFAIGVEEHDGKLFARLGNPWGDHQPDLVPCDEFKTWFSSVSIGSP